MATIFAQIPRGPGLIRSGARTVPAGAKGQQVIFTALMDPVDKSDPTLTFNCGVQWSQDGGATWGDLAAQTFQGGLDKFGQPREIRIVVSVDGESGSFLPGSQVRVFADLPRIVPLGLTLDFNG